MILWLLACGAEPDPWHGAVRVERVLGAEGTCTPGDEETDPVAPWLFVAVVDGDPGISSLYWCTGPDECPPGPFVTVELDRLGPARLAGTTGSYLRVQEVCQVGWDSVDAERDGDEVTVTWRTFLGETEVPSEAACRGFLEDVFEADCDSVLVIEGSWEG